MDDNYLLALSIVGIVLSIFGIFGDIFLLHGSFFTLVFLIELFCCLKQALDIMDEKRKGGK